MEIPGAERTEDKVAEGPETVGPDDFTNMSAVELSAVRSLPNSYEFLNFDLQFTLI